MKPTIIAIIAAPGAGKTYLANKLKNKLNATLITEPPINKRILENLKEQKRNLETIIYFLNKGIINIEKAHELKNKNQIVIMDTYWLSTFLHTKAMLKNFEKHLMIDLQKTISKYFLKPDIIIFLKTSKQHIIKNIYSRKRNFDTNKNYIKRISLIKDIHEKYIQKHQNNKTYLIKIEKDNFDFSLDKHLDIIISKIKKINKNQ